MGGQNSRGGEGTQEVCRKESQPSPSPEATSLFLCDQVHGAGGGPRRAGAAPPGFATAAASSGPHDTEEQGAGGVLVAGQAWERYNSFPPSPTGQVNRGRAVQATGALRGQDPRPMATDWLDAGCDHGRHGLGCGPRASRQVGARVHSQHQWEKSSVSSPLHTRAHTLNLTLRSTGHSTLRAWSLVWPSSLSMTGTMGQALSREDAVCGCRVRSESLTCWNPQMSPRSRTRDEG